MAKIDYTIEIEAPKNKVWEIISDLDNEYEYWYGTKDVRNISKEGNIINREITQNFRNHKILQKVILHPEDSVEIEYLKGLTEGSKIISIEPLTQNRQRVRVVWNAHFTGIFRLFTPWLKRHTEKGTIGALERMKRAAESQVDKKMQVQ